MSCTAQRLQNHAHLTAPEFVIAIEMVKMSQKEFQRLKIIENARGRTAERGASSGIERRAKASAEQPHLARLPFGSATISESTRS
jgi:hypothetical protein